MKGGIAALRKRGTERHWPLLLSGQDIIAAGLVPVVSKAEVVVALSGARERGGWGKIV